MTQCYQAKTDVERREDVYLCSEWKHRIHSIIGHRLPDAICRQFHKLQHPNSEVCRHTPDCISWSKMQKQYMRRKDEIDAKFQQIVRGSHPLVEDCFIRRDNRQLFPLSLTGLVSTCSPYYANQQCVQIKTHVVQTPHDQPWMTVIEILDRGGKQFVPRRGGMRGF
ncbi:uncharacterized protein QC763_0081250 [Podospora pseudopauciseta]|uniref:Uncharacterized protein n=1 Tax=Podospora pseudopauciseta TaxID=2093780 RepID=A0ABR0H7K6_9PEZI|nr:hypothetical protein QC763_0081250 [Podospora pseudopauciseta]